MTNAIATFDAAGHMARSKISPAAGNAAPETEPGRDEKSIRLQLNVSKQSMVRLVKLTRHIEAAGYAEVVKNALRLYEALIAETENGSQFLLRDKDGNLAPFRMFVP